MEGSKNIFQDIAEYFVNWTKQKIRHHLHEDKKNLYFNEGQIWWSALGKNIGFEMDGKHELFTRSVLILKKYSSTMCFVLPLTTKIKDNNPPYQFTFHLNGRKNAVNLTQGRTISTKRLLQKEGYINKKIFNQIKDSFIDCLK